jgi:urease gamma subunit
MTTLLEEAFAKASQLPPKEQDALAALLLEEIASEKRWQGLFSQSQEQLAKLAEEALAEFDEGKTEPL